jgi:hypothetical protein
MEVMTALAVIDWALSNVPKAVALLQNHANTGDVPTEEQVAQMIGDAESASETITQNWLQS